MTNTYDTTAIDWILSQADKFFGMKESIKTKSREQAYVHARYMVMMYCKQYTNASLKQIGELLGGRDHSTVIHGQNEHSVMMDLSAKGMSMFRNYAITYIELEAFLNKYNPDVEQMATFSPESLERGYAFVA